jgi:hypothetical protein
VSDWIDGDAARFFRRIERLLELLIEKVDNLSAQSQIDAATAAMTDATSALNTAAPEIEANIGAGVNTSALDAAVGPLQAAVAGIVALAEPVTTATATSTTSTGTTSSTTASTGTTASTSTVTTAAPAARTVGTGLPGDPVRPA